tara:strand:- start:775 stop:1239 length:465 start_codon:yes stop_codon:yes gene_type:complete
MPDARDFLRVNQIGPQEDLEFTNSDGGPTLFVMRGIGEPTSSADTKSIVTYGYLVGNFVTRQQYFSGSQSSSISSGNPVYQVELSSTGSQRINESSLDVHLNGISLRREVSSNEHSSDYILSGSNNIIIYTPTGSYGYSLKEDDRIKIKWQQGH